MLKLYWQTVFRQRWGYILLLTLTALLAATAEVANIGMLVPMVSLFTGGGTSAGNAVLDTLGGVLRNLGIDAEVASLFFAASLGVAVLVLARVLFVVIHTYITIWMAQDMRRSLAVELFDAYLHAPYHTVESRSRGSMVADIEGGGSWGFGDAKPCRPIAGSGCAISCWDGSDLLVIVARNADRLPRSRAGDVAVPIHY